MGTSYSIPDIKSVHYAKYVETMPDLKGKTFAVTGCTTGLGLAAAKACAARGGNLLLLNRPSSRAEAALQSLQEAAQPGAKVLQVDCDLQDFASVRDAAADVKAKLAQHGLHLDVLCNNAGVMAMPEQVTKDGYDVQMQTNHISHFLLTRELMPELDKAAAAHGGARVVNHSSMARRMPGTQLSAKYFSKGAAPGVLGGDKGRWERYHQSKLANVVFTEALQDRLDAKSSKVIAAVAHPGFAASNLQLTTANNGGGLGLQAIMRFCQSAEDGALPLLHCMTAPGVGPRAFFVPTNKGVIGVCFGETTHGPPRPWKAEAICTNAGAKETLWSESEKAVGAFGV